MSIYRRVKSHVMRNSRDKKTAHFYSLCPRDAKVLDVGVSSESESSPPHRNHFLKTFRFRSENYVGLGIQDLSEMSSMYPGKCFVQYPGDRFPFKDKEFEWVYSNAVIEHVGNQSQQIQFVNEMLRVAKGVFFTTPYKFFPIESHTNIVLLHWFDKLFFGFNRSRRPWLSKDSLNLLSYHSLNEIMFRSNARRFTIYKNRLLGLTMTFSVVCADDKLKAVVPTDAATNLPAGPIM